MLTNEEYENLKSEIPNADEYIEKLSSYVESKGAKYKSHYATIRVWYRKDKGKTETKRSSIGAEYTDIYSLMGGNGQ